jgi:hypothetical protein
MVSCCYERMYDAVDSIKQGLDLSQAAEIEAPASQGVQGVVRSGQRRARSAWYSAKYGAERAGHALLGWLTTAWLWLLQAWEVVAEWGRQCWGALLRAWHRIAGAVMHAVHWVRSLGSRPGPA